MSREKLDTTQNPKSVFEIPTVNESWYLKTREALAKEGYTFVIDILPVSIGQLVADEATSQRFGYVNASVSMRAIVPQRMEVAINPNNLRIKKSNNKPTGDQIRILKEEAAALKAKLPSEVRGLVSMRMPNASVLVQLDNKYQEETGEPLFTAWFGRTDDQTVPGRVAGVGRGGPAGRLNVFDWRRDGGTGDVFVVPMVVFPRKLAV